jgi:hypothetical protein
MVSNRPTNPTKMQSRPSRRCTMFEGEWKLKSSKLPHTPIMIGNVILGEGGPVFEGKSDVVASTHRHTPVRGLRQHPRALRSPSQKHVNALVGTI